VTAAARPERGEHAHAERDRDVLRVIWMAGGANVAVLLLKLWVGLTTGSLAVLSDALHSLSDAANNVVAWFVVRVSTRPADRDHPYGHRKFETLAVFGLASLLSVLAFQIAMSALRRVPQPIAHDDVALAMMGAVLAVNVALTVWEHRQARRLDSELLRADAGHTLSDVLATIVVVGGWQLSARGFPWLDRLCALGVAVLVLALAYGLFKRAIPVLVDTAALDPEGVVAAVAAIPGVRGVRDVRSRRTGAGAAVDLVVEVDAHLPTLGAHEISDRVETLLRRRFGVTDATVHVEPDSG
jgi:cation diffusion facilitator family transporter